MSDEKNQISIRYTDINPRYMCPSFSLTIFHVMEFFPFFEQFYLFFLGIFEEIKPETSDWSHFWEFSGVLKTVISFSNNPFRNDS